MSTQWIYFIRIFQHRVLHRVSAAPEWVCAQMNNVQKQLLLNYEMYAI